MLHSCRFGEMCDSAEGVLEGDQLEEALQSMNGSDQEELSEDKLRYRSMSDLKYQYFLFIQIKPKYLCIAT